MSSMQTGAPLTSAQVLRRLADHEREGVAFYQGLLQATDSDDIRKLAEMMIRAERRHRERFLAYARKAEALGSGSGNALTGPLPAQLTRLLGTRVFVDLDRAKKTAAYANDNEILSIAIRAEESLALLLTQLRDFVPRGQRPFIGRVIKEEWNHKAKLEQIKKKCFP